MDKGDLDDERVLRRHWDKPKVAVIAPSTVTINQCHVRGEDMMDVSDGSLVRYPRILREGWGREAVNDGVERQGMCHLLSSFQLLW